MATRLIRYLVLLIAFVVPAVTRFNPWTPLGAAAPAGAPAKQTQKPEATAVISGVVLDGSTGDPLPEAVVFITSTPARPLGPQTRQLTDERGRFAFVNLPGDVAYTLAADKLGYLDGGFGRDATPADPLREIPLKIGEWMPDIKISLWKPGAISGVVRDESGEPVVGAVVRALQRVKIQARDEFLTGPATRTDDRGAYRLANLTPGRYVVQAPSVQASVPTSSSLTEPAGPGPARGGGLGAEVLDVMDVDVAQRLVIGRYAIPPPPKDGRQMAYPAVFHPAALAVAEATTVDLKFGDDRSRVDIVLTPVPSVRVSGIVEGPPEALRALTLRLLPVGLENLGFGAEVATALVSAEGQFMFLNVPAGSYIIDAPVYVSELSMGSSSIGPQRILPGPPTTPVMGAMGSKIDLFPAATLSRYNFRFSSAPFTGRSPVTVGGADLTDVVVRMRPHATIVGRVIVERDPAQPAVEPPARFVFQVDPAAGDIALSSSGGAVGRGGGAAGSGGFTVANVIPGQYWLRVQGAPGWIVKSVTQGGRDFSNTPIDASAGGEISDVVVTVTNATAEIAGVVKDIDDLKGSATMVIVFPADQAMWKNTGLWPARLKTTAVSSKNAFRLAGLPAGDYLVAAISRQWSTTWRDAEFLVRASRVAQRVTVDWGGKSTIDLTATVIK